MQHCSLSAAHAPAPQTTALAAPPACIPSVAGSAGAGAAAPAPAPALAGCAAEPERGGALDPAAVLSGLAWLSPAGSAPSAAPRAVCACISTVRMSLSGLSQGSQA